MKLYFLFILSVFILFSSCRSIPKEKSKTSISVNESDKSSIQEKQTEKVASVSENENRAEENTSIDENTIIEETVKEYNTIKVDSGYISVLKKETKRTISNSKNQNTNKKEDNSSKENKESEISKDVNTNINKNINVKGKNEEQTEASPDPNRWKYIFGIVLIVFVSGIFIYKKFIKK